MRTRRTIPIPRPLNPTFSPLLPTNPRRNSDYCSIWVSTKARSSSILHVFTADIATHKSRQCSASSAVQKKHIMLVDLGWNEVQKISKSRGSSCGSSCLMDEDDLLGVLRIKVKRGIGLEIRDFRSSDPYVIIRLGDQTMKTGVIDKNLNPVWNEDMTLSITNRDV
ncbi:hypothetical protein L6452_18297 [Arctium lappa]|uniref:Uncharacterized protein n=1 Tax=Arctium lappa TaxID=4217 RepID=A0ACB9C5S0_ARCLA|nr:hypothetical protein L6452_18297 [Arctium lappa]